MLPASQDSELEAGSFTFLKDLLKPGLEAYTQQQAMSLLQWLQHTEGKGRASGPLLITLRG